MTCEISYINNSGTNEWCALDGTVCQFGPGESTIYVSNTFSAGGTLYTVGVEREVTIQQNSVSSSQVVQHFAWQYPFWLGASHATIILMVVFSLVIYRKFGRVAASGGSE